MKYRAKENRKSIASWYNPDRLVYYDGLDLVAETIDRKKFIKSKSRKQKIELLKSMNPEWNDLTDSVSAMIGKQ